jgi:ABC-2 type transport system ATP-binding protein
MSGKNFLDFIQSYRGSTEVRRRNELIDRFELDPTGLIKRMSKGMKQKVAIVAAFMHKPDILILDEPTSGLDPLMRSRFIALIEEEQHDGTTILMSSHIFEEVERTCNRVGIINKGNLVATDSIDVLKEQQVRRYTVTFADGASTQEFLREPFSSTLVQEQQLEVTVSGNLRAFLTSLSRYPVINLVTPTQNLEDIFMHYYADGEQS